MDLWSVLTEGGAMALMAGAILLVRRDIKGVHAHLQRLESWLHTHARRLDAQGEAIAWIRGRIGGPMIPEDASDDTE